MQGFGWFDKSIINGLNCVSITLGDQNYFLFATKNYIVVSCSVFATDFRSAMRILLGRQISEISLPLHYMGRYHRHHIYIMSMEGTYRHNFFR
jgi:hypothetical protein